MICGGESPQTRHDRIESEKMDSDARNANRERFADPIILGPTDRETIDNLLFAVRSYQEEIKSLTASRKVHDQAVRMAELRVHNDWSRTQDWLPDRPLCVLAWDGETHFVAVYEGKTWWNAHLDEEIDSVVTHWCHLPEPSREQL